MMRSKKFQRGVSLLLAFLMVGGLIASFVAALF